MFYVHFDVLRGYKHLRNLQIFAKEFYGGVFFIRKTSRKFVTFKDNKDAHCENN